MKFSEFLNEAQGSRHYLVGKLDLSIISDSKQKEVRDMLSDAKEIAKYVTHNHSVDPVEKDPSSKLKSLVYKEYTVQYDKDKDMVYVYEDIEEE